MDVRHNYSNWNLLRTEVNASPLENCVKSTADRTAGVLVHLKSKKSSCKILSSHKDYGFGKIQ